MTAGGETRVVCADCLRNGFKRSECAYCGAMLSSRHEHDHMPVPFRAGGVDAVPVCINCHDLKDRTDPTRWDQGAFREALEDAPPLARIVIAKLLSDLHDLQLERDQWTSGGA